MTHEFLFDRQITWTWLIAKVKDARLLQILLFLLLWKTKNKHSGT
jgi:hypothetical protein